MDELGTLFSLSNLPGPGKKLYGLNWQAARAGSEPVTNTATSAALESFILRSSDSFRQTITTNLCGTAPVENKERLKRTMQSYYAPSNVRPTLYPRNGALTPYREVRLCPRPLLLPSPPCLQAVGREFYIEALHKNGSKRALLPLVGFGLKPGTSYDSVAVGSRYAKPHCWDHR